MLLFAPYLTWLAVCTSVIMLGLLASMRQLGRYDPIVVALVCLAAYWQFFATTAVDSAIGLGLQTVLAIYLVVRWRLSAG